MPPTKTQPIVPSGTNGTPTLQASAPSPNSRVAAFRPPSGESTASAFRTYNNSEFIPPSVALQMMKEHRQRLVFARTSHESAQRMRFSGERHEMTKSAHSQQSKQQAAQLESTRLDIAKKTLELDARKADSAADGLRRAKDAVDLIRETVDAFNAADGLLKAGPSAVPMELFKEYGVAIGKLQDIIRQEIQKQTGQDPFPNPTGPQPGGGELRRGGARGSTAAQAAPPPGARMTQGQGGFVRTTPTRPSQLQASPIPQASPGAPAAPPAQPGSRGAARSHFTTAEGHTYEQREDGRWHLVE